LAAVLLGDDVIEMKGQLSKGFREATILTPMLSPGSDGFVNRFVHARV
jgi:hypothetical protein